MANGREGFLPAPISGDHGNHDPVSNPLLSCHCADTNQPAVATCASIEDSEAIALTPLRHASPPPAVGRSGFFHCEKVGKVGQTFLDPSFIGGIISIAALVRMASLGNTWWLLVSGFVLMFSFLAIFGLKAGKKGVLRPIQATLLLSG